MLNVTSDDFERRLREGEALYKAKRYKEAGDMFLSILRQQPRHVSALRGFAHAAAALEKHELAANAARDALRFGGEHANMLRILGHAAFMNAQPIEAIEAHKRLSRLVPGEASAEIRLALAYQLAGLAEEAMEVLDRAIRQERDATTASELGSAFLYQMHYMACFSGAEIAEAHRQWGLSHPKKEQARQWGPRFIRGARKLRVGYVSADFRNHAVARFFMPLLQHHDRERVSFFCYSSSTRKDGVTGDLKEAAAGGEWREIVGMTDEAAAEVILGDGIDVLVDLAGHTADHRLGVFALRAAPVQVTWLGYPDTTGLSTMDWRVVDEITDPVGMEVFSTEKLLRIRSPFLCYYVAPGLPEVGRLPAEEAGRSGGVITFGSFNAFPKVNKACIGRWAEVMKRVEAEGTRSRIILKAAALSDGSVRERVLREFEEFGIGRDRVEMIQFTKTVFDHLALYGRVDIALDTFPYGGTTTTCEALSMGVPVVTRMGDRHASRVSGSLVTAVGHPEWASETEEGFVAAAVALARDVGRLARVRAGLRGEVMGSRLTDGAGFARAWEEAMEGVAGGTG